MLSIVGDGAHKSRTHVCYITPTLSRSSEISWSRLLYALHAEWSRCLFSVDLWLSRLSVCLSLRAKTEKLLTGNWF